MSDIRVTLEAVQKRLNEFLQAAAPRPEAWVVLSNLVDPEGKAYDGARNRLVMFLANVQKETSISTAGGPVPVSGSQYAVVAPPLFIDLYVLVFANFYDASYAGGLEVLSRAISFFQQNPAFNPSTLPGLPPEVDRLTFELVNLEPIGLSYIMGIAGVKYLPSVYYKVRLLPFQAAATQSQAPAVQGLQNPGEPAEQLVSAGSGSGGLRGGEGAR